MNTQSHQDYLKAVYILSTPSKWVTTSALAEHLRVRPSSVTAMVKKLSAASPRLLDYKPHRGVALTEAGRRIALDVTRRHRLIEQFLVSMMGFDWDEVHEEADRLEHCVSARFIDRVDELLGRPERDPHGRPIPSKSGEVQIIEELRLSEAALNEPFKVSSVGSEEKEFLKYLSEIGLKPDVIVRVSEASAAGGTLCLDIITGQKNKKQVIGTRLAEKIFVSEAS